jgi:hypothetical protein
MAFAVEIIPNDAGLFRKIHRTHYDERTGVVSSAAFKQDRMSVNWEKYKTAADSADQNSAAVVVLTCADCRDLAQSVEHTPIEPDRPWGPNQAHVEVCGKKTGAISHKLRDLARMAWLRVSV